MSIISKAKHFIATEPAILIGTAGAGAEVGVTYLHLSASQGKAVSGAVTLIASAFIRSAVVPNAKFTSKVEAIEARITKLETDAAPLVADTPKPVQAVVHKAEAVVAAAEKAVSVGEATVVGTVVPTISSEIPTITLPVQAPAVVSPFRAVAVAPAADLQPEADPRALSSDSAPSGARALPAAAVAAIAAEPAPVGTLFATPPVAPPAS